MVGPDLNEHPGRSAILPAGMKGNAEIVRTALDAWNRRDWDQVFVCAAPDLELDNSNAAGEYRGVHQGRDQAKRMFKQFLEPWESVRLELVEVVENGDRVFTTETGMCWTFRDSSLARVFMTNEVGEAWKAAGLDLS